jgi:hypothetical protein
MTETQIVQIMGELRADLVRQSLSERPKVPTGREIALVLAGLAVLVILGDAASVSTPQRLTAAAQMATYP